MQTLDGDSVLPVQHAASRGPRGGLQPEQLLLAAILEDAVDAYLERGEVRSGRRRGALTAVETWFAEDEPSAPFSFTYVCQALGLEPSAVRAALARRRNRATERSMRSSRPPSARRPGRR